MIYDVNYFIKKFEVIAEELWCTNFRTNGNQHCALGFCDHRNYISDRDNPEASALLVLNKDIAKINNGDIKKYHQSTPKQRVLASLYDIRDKEIEEANIKEANIIVNTEVEKVF